MNNDTVAENPPTRRRSRWKTAGWVTVWVVTLLVLAVALENFLGARAWQAEVARERSLGEPTEVAQILPPPAADAENFGALPLFRPLLDYEWLPPARERTLGEARFRDPEAKKKLEDLKLTTPRNPGNWRASELTNLEAWQRELKVEGEGPAAVLAALARFDAPLAALSAASDRPRSRFPVHYEEHVMAAVPHVSVLMNLARAARLRALAELSAGKIDEAHHDILLSITLAEALREEPLLISQLVRIAIWELIMQPLWEGLARRQWSEAQLASFDAALQRPDLVAATQMALRGERLLVCNEALNAIKRQPAWAFVTFKDGSSRPSPLWNVVGWLIPVGWIEFNKVKVSGFYSGVQRTADPAAHRFYPAELARVSDDFRQRVANHRWNPHNVLAAIIFPAVETPFQHFAAAQVTLDMARVAIALERHRLAHGAWPEKLAELPPVLHDAMSGEAFHYRREGGAFTLYSIGWNGKDDQGLTAWKPNAAQRNVDWPNGDWVWPLYPAER